MFLACIGLFPPDPQLFLEFIDFLDVFVVLGIAAFRLFPFSLLLGRLGFIFQLLVFFFLLLKGGLSHPLSYLLVLFVSHLGLLPGFLILPLVHFHAVLDVQSVSFPASP